ncbi:MAG: hypothetical protein JW818_04430, partial [Pirellulales bacterium]|nr:hypothetical protein [Pirellulales bacterium]
MVESLERRVLLDVAGGGAVIDAFEVHQNSGRQPLDVLANDALPEGPIAAVSYGSEGGRIEIADDGQSILYAPPADFAGTETFTYYGDAGQWATVTVAVLAPLESDEFEALPTGDSMVLDVLANDPFWDSYAGPGRITAVSHTHLESDVTIAEDGKSLVYTTPTQVAAGEDSFVYIVDGFYPAEVTIHLPDPLEADSYPGLVQKSEGNVLDVLANDPFWLGYSGPRKITHVIEPDSGGTVSIAEDGVSLIYTPSPEHVGSDQLRYVVDGLYEETVTVYVHRPVQDDSAEIDMNSTDFTLPLLGND